MEGSVREIALDTETTGLDATCDRIVEIACIELRGHIPTGAAFHSYVNPGRAMGAEATMVTGITDEMLAGQPSFGEVAERFLSFIGEDQLVIHNAAFDLRFLNEELGRSGRPPLAAARAIDTLDLARRRFPGAQLNLDALCRRLGVDNSERETHGALIDAQLLARVYLELRGGVQRRLELGVAGAAAVARAVAAFARTVELEPRLSEDELREHARLVDRLGQAAIWRRYMPTPAGDLTASAP